MAYYNRGMTYTQLGEFRRAIEDYDDVIHLDSQNVKAYAFRALAHTALNMDTEAQQDFDQAVRLGFDASFLRAEMEKLREQRQR